MALPELFRVESYGTSAPSPHARNHVTDIDRILLSILRYRDTRQRNSTPLAKLPIAIAQLTSSGLIDCGFLWALGDILSSNKNYPDIEKRKKGGPNTIGGDVIAGAQ